ncbi:MAG: beta-lactamase family protein, partial [Chloroflexota bacterium]|nr:beta-lactamase family protein [Chloroflexota bacterium]
MLPSRPSRFDLVAQAAHDILVQQSLPSLAIAVAQHGEILWEEGFGWADREAMIPATPHSMYSLASISKPITATALMVLKERGLVDLRRPINEYLGDVCIQGHAGDPADATVLRVASHTSGLPLHHHFFYKDEPYPRPPMGETIRRYGNLVSAPGERYQDSNLGYGILDHL